MLRQRPVSLLLAFILGSLCLCAAAVPARADEPEFDALTKYIQKNYQAKRVKIPFLGLARFAVKIIRPAGVKSFKLATFKDIQYADSTPGVALNLLMREVLSEDWQPLLRIRAQTGEQMYVYARPVGKDIKVLLASIDKEEAFVAHIKFSPKALAKWMQNPQIMGVSLH